MKNINFDLSKAQRAEAWDFLTKELEIYYDDTVVLPVSPTLDKHEIKNYVHQSFAIPLPIENAIEHVVNGLKRFSVHTPHPSYFGLFNPRANFAGILADTVTATFNPQLAAWSHAPFAAEVESNLILEFGKKFGFNSSTIDGVFTNGGAEANLTAILCALNTTFPDYAIEGLQALDKKPVIYVSAESHHSLIKAASITGLGLNAIKEIPANEQLQMNAKVLEQQIKQDLKSDLYPVMIVATMGTTGAGAIDAINEIATIASANNIWLHADAAYGGALALTDRFNDSLKDMHLADSITFDAHKWMSVPMGTSMFITKHTSILNKTFRVTTDYMPKEANDLQVTDQFTHSIQWSRRFTGLKVYLSLLMFGWQGYQQVIERQIKLGTLLKNELEDSGWFIYNHTLLPIACFGKKYFEAEEDAALNISKKIIESGKAWLSVYKINGVNTLRACITNYATDETNVKELVKELNKNAQSN